MRLTLCLALVPLAFASLALAVPVIGEPATFDRPQPAPTVAAHVDSPLPGWMSGMWQMQDGAAWAEEMWTDPRDGMMLGLGREGFGARVKVWESTRIITKGEGKLVYVAQVKGAQAVEFPMTVASEESIEFANPAHDYPQRIHYWRQGQLLMAEVSLMDGSRAERWNYRPVAIAQPEMRTGQD